MWRSPAKTTSNRTGRTTSPPLGLGLARAHTTQGRGNRRRSLVHFRGTRASDDVGTLPRSWDALQRARARRVRARAAAQKSTQSSSSPAHGALELRRRAARSVASVGGASPGAASGGLIGRARSWPANQACGSRRTSVATSAKSAVVICARRPTDAAVLAARGYVCFLYSCGPVCFNTLDYVCRQAISIRFARAVRTLRRTCDGLGAHGGKKPALASTPETRPGSSCPGHSLGAPAMGRQIGAERAFRGNGHRSSPWRQLRRRHVTRARPPVPAPFPGRPDIEHAPASGHPPASPLAARRGAKGVCVSRDKTPAQVADTRSKQGHLCERRAGC